MPALLQAVTNTADPTPVGTWLEVAVIAYLAYRVMKIVLFPNAPCSWCKGSGKKFDGKFWRPCRWCRGAGKKTRFGRKVWNYVTTKQGE